MTELTKKFELSKATAVEHNSPDGPQNVRFNMDRIKEELEQFNNRKVLSFEEVEDLFRQIENKKLPNYRIAYVDKIYKEFLLNKKISEEKIDQLMFEIDTDWEDAIRKEPKGWHKK